jgi:hypothetical protein
MTTRCLIPKHKRHWYPHIEAPKRALLSEAVQNLYVQIGALGGTLKSYVWSQEKWCLNGGGLWNVWYGCFRDRTKRSLNRGGWSQGQASDCSDLARSCSSAIVLCHKWLLCLCTQYHFTTLHSVRLSLQSAVFLLQRFETKADCVMWTVTTFHIIMWKVHA